MKPFPRLLIASAIVLLVINLYAVAALEVATGRWVRIVSSGCFLLLYFFKLSAKTLLIGGALVSFLIADVFSLSYDETYSKKVFFVLHALSYFMLTLHIILVVNMRKISRHQFFFLLFSFLVLCALLMAFGLSFTSEIENAGLLYYFYAHGLSLITILISALGVYDNKINSFSLFFLVAALGLLFSDLTAFPAYYLEADGFYYFTRIFYLIGLSSLVYFSYLRKKPVVVSEELPAPPSEEDKPINSEASYHEH